jgi:hypothetical protein
MDDAWGMCHMVSAPKGRRQPDTEVLGLVFFCAIERNPLKNTDYL